MVRKLESIILTELNELDINVNSIGVEECSSILDKSNKLYDLIFNELNSIDHITYGMISSIQYPFVRYMIEIVVDSMGKTIESDIYTLEYDIEFPSKEDLFFDDLKKIGLMDYESEKVLFKEVSRLRKEKRAILRETDVVIDEDKLKYINRRLAELKKTIMEKNERLVVSIANRYSNKDYLLDSIQNGNLGLSKAFDKYNYSKKQRFSSYATWWIRKYVLEGREYYQEVIRLPKGKKELHQRYLDYVDSYYQDYGSLPTDKEIVEYLGIDLKELKELYEIQLEYPSLNQEIIKEGYTGTEQLGDFIKDPDNDVISDIENSQLKSDLYEYMHKYLNEREIIVLSEVFGLYDNIPKSYEVVGVKLKISRDRVKQIQERALRKLNKNGEVLKYYLNI